jgi:hypothetical protein
MKGNSATKSINKGKGFKQMGNLMFIPEIKSKYCYTMQALNAHGAGRWTKPNPPRVRENSHSCKGLI